MPTKSSPQVQERWKRHVAAWRRCGGSVAAYCRRHKLSEQSFFNWRRRFGTMLGRARQRPAFLPVKVVGAAGGVELVLRTGQVIRLQGGFEVARIAELVRELEGANC